MTIPGGYSSDFFPPLSFLVVVKKKRKEKKVIKEFSRKVPYQKQGLALGYQASLKAEQLC